MIEVGNYVVLQNSVGVVDEQGIYEVIATTANSDLLALRLAPFTPYHKVKKYQSTRRYRATYTRKTPTKSELSKLKFVTAHQCLLIDETMVDSLQALQLWSTNLGGKK